MKYKLSDICDYVKGKVNLEEIDEFSYISTENMLPGKAGITKATSLPSITQTQIYCKNDVLVSNIRPYFKKIWYATRDGGCSNDVLVFRAKENTDSTFLYYVLADDKFFEYSMATSKGTKMPRGDKKSIMDYEVFAFDIVTQKRIGNILKVIDEKIELNKKINENLEQQLKALFSNMFSTQIENLSEPYTTLGELIEIIDNRGKTPPLASDITVHPIIDVKALSGNSRIVNYSNCTKYVSKETYDSWFRSGHPHQYDILISTVGSVAEMKIFMGNIGCIAQNVVGFRCKRISPLYLYQYLNFIKSDLVAYNIGSVQPSIKVTHIIKHGIYVPNTKELTLFNDLAESVTAQIYSNCNEIENLKQLRDSLLPKLMSGELDISELDI